jgi:hypothetical protein
VLFFYDFVKLNLQISQRLGKKFTLLAKIYFLRQNIGKMAKSGFRENLRTFLRARSKSGKFFLKKG